MQGVCVTARGALLLRSRGPGPSPGPGALSGSRAAHFSPAGPALLFAGLARCWRMGVLLRGGQNKSWRGKLPVLSHPLRLCRPRELNRPTNIAGCESVKGLEQLFSQLLEQPGVAHFAGVGSGGGVASVGGRD